ncbi:MAG: hypothetical protein KF760_23885 [Candidatus Eremiobacteraeota bacterium]|nr:hypothetical protein [Candidatus Eremiobacteraeota bacterium]MCW5866606.1 hypothetical protein [Candidatus Eremiobacteraeota bacterium]
MRRLAALQSGWGAALPGLTLALLFWIGNADLPLWLACLTATEQLLLGRPAHFWDSGATFSTDTSRTVEK